MDEILHQLIVTWLSFFWIHLYMLCSTEYSIIDTVDGWNPAPVDCHMTLFFLNTSIYFVFNCIFIIDTVDGWNPAPVDCHMTLFFWIHLYILCSTVYSIIDTVDGWNPAPVDCHMTLFFLNTSIYVVFNCIFHNWHCWWMKSCTSWLSHDSFFLNTSIYVVFKLYIP